MSGIEGVFLDIIFMLENMVMICGVFCVPVSVNKKCLIVGGNFLIVLCFGDIWIGFDDLVMLLLRACLNIVIVLLWTEGKLFRKLAIYICSIMYLHMLYLCIDLIFSSLFLTSITVLETHTFYRIMRGAITVLVTVVLAHKLRNFRTYKNILMNLQTKYFLIGSICCLATSLLQHYIEDMSELKYGNLDQFICVIVCMVIVSIMFYALGVGVVVLDMLRKKYQAESKLKDEYL